MSGPGAARSFQDIAPALAAVPVFPLPQVALFPGALLPLHIFEPRYRAMIRDVIDSHRTLCVAQIVDPARREEGLAAPAPGSPSERERPPIARVAGVGVLVDYAELPSGRFNILVRGRARVSLDELPFVPPYRRARATILASSNDAVPASDIAGLISTATSFASLVRERDKKFELRLPRDTDAGTLADLCAAQLLIDGRDRQRALEATDSAERVRLVTETIALQRLAIAGEPGPPN
jgi:ATP-dependent Lon protease